MKNQQNPGLQIKSNRFYLLAGVLFLPLASQAQGQLKTLIPIEMNLVSYLIIGFLLVFSVIMFFLFQHRYNLTARELKDISSELGTTRQRLAETGKDLEDTQKNLKDVSKRYQGILYEANVGMFQMDLTGRCSFINTALQEMSGLYPKKALKEGLLCAVHPDDHASFKTAWDAFVKHSETFDQIFRFQRDKAADVYVLCHANKVYNSRKEVDSYIGWVTDITRFHDKDLLQQAATARYKHFVSETVEAFYKLESTEPIPLVTEPGKMTEAIMHAMVLTECNDTFAAMYGSKPEELIGKPINALKDGCGPFRNNATIESFIEEGFRSVDLESIRQDPSGNRLNLLNQVVGIIEDSQLVGIWGSQRNISQQKREKAELSSQVRFMHRILSALPADVHVKDTRCRYLYASEKLAKRTGIPQEEWIGKTISEVLPGTPRDHDKMAIETMKSGTLHRSESHFETAGKSGWMETVQIPLISDESLVEGVVGLSLDITDRKKKEEEAYRERAKIEAQLEHIKEELADSRVEYGKTATALSDAVQNLKIAEAEKVNREHEFAKQLEEQKTAEATLRRHEESLLMRQRQLEEELSNRLQDLEQETDKRKKWEELLDIREYELRKAEDHLAQISAQFEKESTLREKAETLLDEAKVDTDKYRKELAALSANSEQTEKQLSKTEELLKKTQEQLKQMSERHTAELEKEVAEHKAAAEKLIQTMEELDKFRHQFSERIDQETKAIKQELAKKQINEKMLRQHEKDLQKRIKELDDSLKQKTKEFTDQIKALEKSDAKRKDLEQTLESVDQRQQERIARETEKLTMQISEIKLEEVKLREQLGDLTEQNAQLENSLKQKTKEFTDQIKALEKSDAKRIELEQAFESVDQRQREQIARETEKLTLQISEIKKEEAKLRKQLTDLTEKNTRLQESLKERDTELAKARKDSKWFETALEDTKVNLKQLRGDEVKRIETGTKELKAKIEEMKKAAEALEQKIANLQAEKKQLEKELENRTIDLSKAAREYRKVVDEHKASQAQLKAETQSREQAEGALQELLKIHESGALNGESGQKTAAARKADSKFESIIRKHQSVFKKIQSNNQQSDRMKRAS